MKRKPLVTLLAGALRFNRNAVDRAVRRDPVRICELMHLTLPAHGFAVLEPRRHASGYTNYKRVQ